MKTKEELKDQELEEVSGGKGAQKLEGFCPGANQTGLCTAWCRDEYTGCESCQRHPLNYFN